MGPDPFNMPSFGSQSAGDNHAALQQAVNQAAPLATQWHGPAHGVPIAQVFNQTTQAKPKGGGILSNLAHFIGGIGSEVGHMASGAAHWLGTNAVNMAESPYHYAQGLSHAILDNQDVNMINAQTKQNTNMLNALHDSYKSGHLTAKQYKDGLQQLIKDTNDVNNQQRSLDSRLASDKGDAYKATIDLASGLVTILTAGFGAAPETALTADGLVQGGEAATMRTAVNYLKSSAANIDLSTVEGTMNKLATNPELFTRLAPSAQKAIQTATAEIVAKGGTMTSAQIARASAVNLALKYPIYYNMLASQGQQIYQKLDDHKYGAAVQQLAINAALLLSGGPIGYALKKAGQGVSVARGAVFGRSAFLDELSKGIGDGSPDGLFRAIMKLPEADRKEVVQNLSSVEATNIAATQGKDAVAAAYRVLNGMSAYEGMSMSQFTHDEALHNMVNFAKAQRLADDMGKKYNLGAITVGRVDARSLNQISSQISPLIEGGDKDSAMNAWEAIKGENPTAAWANNENFDRQIKNLINRHDNPADLDAAIRNIKASFRVEGFPTAEAHQLEKMGYIPIKPVNLEAPFKEGSGQVATQFTGKSNDFFLKAVTPVPILKSVGSLLTGMGLSPEASTSRVYQMFNSNLADNISNSSFIHMMADKGSTDLETADLLVKRLSNYLHNPETFAQKAAPITDLRQMTTGDIMRALPEISKRDAKELKGAILDAMLQVPLQVRGLGDKLVDVAYTVNPTQKALMRIQQGARFAWNPFFQAKLTAKTEILAQAEAGGKFPTVGGVDKILSVIFPDKYRELDSVRTVLRTGGVFDEKTALIGEGMTGEAAEATGATIGRNLNHKLLPSQERSIAGLVSVQADRVNMSVQDFVKYNNEAVRDTVQMIAQYDRNSAFLHSAMARTLNLAFFPFRFEYKVASVMARNLSQRSLMTQLAVVNGLYRAHDWLNSQEGQAWYSHNADVIGLVKYFTPIQTLGEVTHLLGMNPDSIGSFGELGGLPFGWIPQLLDSEGLTNFGGAYVSPKSGQTLPDYVPATDKGKLAAAIQDMIGSLYTYPGATAGLPSKTSIDRNIALGITGASKKADFIKTTPDISPRQQNFAQAIQSANASNAVPENTQILGGTPNQTEPTTIVPRTKAAIDTTPGKLSNASTKVKKKKKSEYIPSTLPGQSSLGQL
jgi:hypothetical protein